MIFQTLFTQASVKLAFRIDLEEKSGEIRVDYEFGFNCSSCVSGKRVSTGRSYEKPVFDSRECDKAMASLILKIREDIFPGKPGKMPTDQETRIRFARALHSVSGPSLQLSKAKDEIDDSWVSCGDCPFSRKSQVT